MWSKEEKLLLLECNTEKAFYQKYIEKIGVPERPTRVSNLWKERNAIRDEFKPVVVPQGKATVLSYGGDRIVDDESIALSNISNKLSELVQIQTETLELFKRIEGRKPNDTVAHS